MRSLLRPAAGQATISPRRNPYKRDSLAARMKIIHTEKLALKRALISRLCS
jgi:hypothetical protein